MCEAMEDGRHGVMGQQWVTLLSPGAAGTGCAGKLPIRPWGTLRFRSALWDCLLSQGWNGSLELGEQPEKGGEGPSQREATSQTPEDFWKQWSRFDSAILLPGRLSVVALPAGSEFGPYLSFPTCRGFVPTVNGQSRSLQFKKSKSQQG